MAARLSQVQIEERRERVLVLAAAGYTPAQIADQIPSLPNANRAAEELRRALQARTSQRRSLGAAGSIDLELARLDTLQRTAEGVLRRAAANDEHQKLTLGAVDTLLRVSKRRTALTAIEGTDPPRQEQGDYLDELQRRRERKLAG